MSYLEKPQVRPKNRQMEGRLWKVFSQFIRLRDADANGFTRCCSCGRVQHWKNCDAGHFLPRNYRAVKYDERNVHAQCGYCNAFLQGNSEEYRKFIIRTYGQAELDRLESLKRLPAKFTRDGLELRIQEYKAKVAELKKRKI